MYLSNYYEIQLLTAFNQTFALQIHETRCFYACFQRFLLLFASSTKFKSFVSATRHFLLGLHFLFLSLFLILKSFLLHFLNICSNHLIIWFHTIIEFSESNISLLHYYFLIFLVLCYVFMGYMDSKLRSQCHRNHLFPLHRICTSPSLLRYLFSQLCLHIKFSQNFVSSINPTLS